MHIVATCRHLFPLFIAGITIPGQVNVHRHPEKIVHGLDSGRSPSSGMKDFDCNVDLGCVLMNTVLVKFDLIRPDFIGSKPIVIEAISSKMEFAIEFRNNVLIMVVDGDLQSLSTTVEIFHSSGYQVESATQASDALDILHMRHEEIDLILADANLFDMNVNNFMHTSRKISTAPIVLMSTHNEKDVMLECVSKEVELFYVIKPIKLSDVEDFWQFVASKKKWAEGNPIGDKGETPVRISVNPTAYNESRVNKSERRKRIWTNEFQTKFELAFNFLGSDEASPKKIRDLMNEPCLTIKQIASHLQKYRETLKGKAKKTRKNISPDQSNFTSPIATLEFTNSLQNSITKQIRIPEFAFEDSSNPMNWNNLNEILQENELIPQELPGLIDLESGINMEMLDLIQSPEQTPLTNDDDHYMDSRGISKSYVYDVCQLRKRS
ncbi:hypothetical protein ACFE04_026649 [Oxalis oulophora]